MNARPALAAAAMLLAVPFTHAADWRPAGAYVVQGGVTAHGTYSVSAGVYWPWAWSRESWSGVWTGYTEAFVSHWSARATGGGRESFTQLGVVPILRYRFAHGRSDWFADGGIGLSVTDDIYRTRDKQFSTRFNFVDTIGVGRSFGAGRSQEVSLRLTHMSNAGIRKPNPGENFLQLRYARSF